MKQLIILIIIFCALVSKSQVTIYNQNRDSIKYISRNNITTNYARTFFESNPDSFNSLIEYELERIYSTSTNEDEVKILLIGKWNYVNTTRTNGNLMTFNEPEEINFYNNGQFIKIKDGNKITGKWEYKLVSKYYLNLYYDKPQSSITDKNKLKELDSKAKKHFEYKSESIQIHFIDANQLIFFHILHLDKNYNTDNHYIRIVYSNFKK